jgi:hypothetical protein
MLALNPNRLNLSSSVTSLAKYLEAPKFVYF